MSKIIHLSEKDREQIGKLKCKITSLRNEISDYEWELRSIYKSKNLSRFEIESTLQNL